MPNSRGAVLAETSPTIDTLSLLFTDLVGSTEMRARQGEDAADEFRRHHDSSLADIVGSHGGLVVKGLGDGIMATFRSAGDAVAAAIAMQQAVESTGRRRAEWEAELRVGVSIGDVSVENGDVFGAPVVEAARLCAAAIGGEILAAELVRALARGRGGFTFESMGDLELKGVTEPVATCRVIWLPLATPAGGAEGALPFPASLTAGTTTGYIGRDAVLQRLRAEWERARAGESLTTLLAGEPGIGKTRTAAEAAKAAYAEGAVVLYGRCDEDLGVPYQPFVAALDWYTAHAATPELGRLPGELGRLLPDLGDRVPGVPDPVASDPRSEEHRLFEAVASWIVELSCRQGLVLVLDDLHWAAKPTLLLLLHVLRSAAMAQPSAARLLVLGTYRDTDIDRAHPLSGVLADLRRLPGVDRIPLEGLSEDELAAFVEQAAGHELDADILRLVSAMHAETEGNPFFIGEVLRHLIETGQVRRQDDRWLVVDPDHVSVPEGVRDVVGRRLSRLSELANSVLSAAAVVGREVALDVLLPLVDATEDQLLDVLDEAVRARLVEEVGADRFRFSHALVRTTLYDELSATRRRRMHRRVADVLEKLHGDDVVALAYHSIEGGPDGGDVSRAVHYSLAAADQAMAARAMADAEARYRQVLELLEDVGDVESPPAIAARCGLGEALREQGAPAFREVLLGAARQALAGGHTDLLVRAVLANHRGTASVVGGTDGERVELAESALAAVGDAPTADRARLLAHLSGEVAFRRSGSERTALADEAAAMARDLGDQQLLAWVTVRSGFGLVSAATWRTLPARLEEVVGVADEIGDPALRVQALWWWAASLQTTGDTAAAEWVLGQADAISADASPLLRWMVRSALIAHRFMRGDVPGAEADSNALLEEGVALGAPDAQAWWAAVGAGINWVRGTVGDLADLAGSFADEYPEAPEWRLAHTWFLGRAGRVCEAKDILADHGVDADALVDRPLPFVALSSAAWSAYLVGDGALAATVEGALAPYAEAWAHYLLGGSGPVESALGVCAAARGELGLAIERLERSVMVRTRGRFDAVAAWHGIELARFLAARGRSGDRDRAVQVLDLCREFAVDHDIRVLEGEVDALVAALAEAR